jgi:peptidoglycan/xylan/chitin deacetylase (PgdA/CDA1 family)
MQARGRRVLITSYHRVVEDVRAELKHSIPGLLISQRTFRRQLEQAAAAGYVFASLGEALEVLSGQRTVRRDLFVVTMDDGYKDVYRYAWPVMVQMGVPATLYLPAALIGSGQRFAHDRLFLLMQRVQQRIKQDGASAWAACVPDLLGPVLSGRYTLSRALDEFIGRHPAAELEAAIATLEAHLGATTPLLPEPGELMDWEEVRRMARDGFEFGAHTLDHRVLPFEPLEEAERQVRESKALIEHHSGVRVQDFAYCNGWYSHELVQVLRRSGFRSAVTTEDLPNRVGDNPYTLKRKVLWEGFSQGLWGGYSRVLTGCHLDGCFDTLGLRQPVCGWKSQRVEEPDELDQVASW